MEQDGKRTKNLLDSIQKNAPLFVQLNHKVQEKEYDMDLVDHCIVAMNCSDDEALSKIIRPEGISDTYYTVQNKSFINPQEMVPKGICINASGVVKTAIELINDLFNVRYLDGTGNISVHAVINYQDGKIYQTLPWNYKGDHQFSELDDSYVGIVICEANACSLEGDPMVETFNSLVALVAWLCKEFDIAINENTLILQNGTGRINDITSYWQGVFDEKDFYEKVKEKMELGISAEELKNAYYA